MVVLRGKIMEYSGAEMNPNNKHKPDPKHKPNLGVGLWVHPLLVSGFDIHQFSQTKIYRIWKMNSLLALKRRLILYTFISRSAVFMCGLPPKDLRNMPEWTLNMAVWVAQSIVLTSKQQLPLAFHTPPLKVHSGTVPAGLIHHLSSFCKLSNADYSKFM